MRKFPSWQFDEMKQVGKDYADIAEVETFDARHGKFRNVEKEEKNEKNIDGDGFSELV